MVGRHDIDDAAWEAVRDCLRARQTMGRPPRDPRQVLNGVFWILRTGKQHGTAFSISADTVVMHFKGCTFVGNQYCVRTWGSPHIHFEDCVFRDNREAKVRGATYENCRFEGNGDDA